MQLIVGLGNPGKEYAHTRHNVGFLVVDKLLEHMGASTSNKFSAEVGEGRLHDEKVLFMKPQTFMNDSGKAVHEAASHYKVPLENILVIHDDLDLPFGKIMIKEGQGSAGHNGVQSIMDAFGGEKNFTRIRIGIGRPSIEDGTGQIPVEDWVLGKWSADEMKDLDALVEGVALEIEK